MLDKLNTTHRNRNGRQKTSERGFQCERARRRVKAITYLRWLSETTLCACILRAEERTRCIDARESHLVKAMYARAVHKTSLHTRPSFPALRKDRSSFYDIIPREFHYGRGAFDRSSPRLRARNFGEITRGRRGPGARTGEKSARA